MESERLKVIAIIPARGNSKSIKNKNLIKIKNRSLIEIINIEAKKSKIFDNIICSTDSKKILNFCKKKKINVILRPKKLSTDSSNVMSAVLHCLDFEEKKNKKYDLIFLLQPTSVMIKSKHISDLFKRISVDRKIKSAQSIHSTPHNYHYLNTRIIKNGKVFFKYKKERLINYNKQKKEKTYHFGNIVATKVKELKKTKNFFVEPSGFVLINKMQSFDLDNKDDLNILRKIIN